MLAPTTFNMKFSPENRPAVGQVVFYSAREKVREAKVVENRTHASFKTPYEQLDNNATLHPSYLYSTEQEAIAETARYSAALDASQGTLAWFIIEQQEAGKLDADAPEMRAQRTKNVHANLAMFKEHHAVGAVRKALPHLTETDAARRFAEGMQIFRILQDAFAHVHCETYSQVMIEELPKS